MSMELTTGALGRMLAGDELSGPLLQVLGTKPIAGGSNKYRLLLSDGKYSNSFAMLSSQLNHMISDGELPNFTIIRANKYFCNNVAGQNRKVLIIIDLDVVSVGSEVNQKIGNPMQIGSDGVVPQNQNSSPNVGQAVKRPLSDSGSDSTSTPEPKKPSVENFGVKRQSVLQNKPSPGIGAGGSIACVPIAAITPYNNKWTIKVRVTSKSDIRTWNKPNNSGKLFSMTFLDESGEIRATAFKEECDRYYDVIQVGKVYHISNCSVKTANKQYSKVNNEYELTFRSDVMVQLVDGNTGDVPTMTYNFVSIGNLDSASKDNNVDIIAICKNAGDVVNLTSRAGKELTKRDITLVDRSATEVQLTLWGSTATAFDADGDPVVAVKGARVSDYSGVSLSGGEIVVNPDMKESHELKGWWENDGKSAATNSLTTQTQRSGGGGDGTFKTFGEVKQENLGYSSDRGDYYSVVGWVIFLAKDKALYKACSNVNDNKECNKKVTESGMDGRYRCEKCQMDLETFRWRLMLQLNVGDCTDHTWASCFQDQAEKILGVKSEDLGHLQEANDERYNAIFTSAGFNMFNFRMRAKSDTYNDETRVKHTIVSIEEINYTDHCRRLYKELKAADEPIPQEVEEFCKNL